MTSLANTATPVNLSRGRPEDAGSRAQAPPAREGSGRSEQPRAASEERGFVVWLTGLSGAGKSTIAEGLAPRLRALGRRVEVLDGDAVREHLSKGLGFSRDDRDTNVARIAWVAHLLARNGVVVIVSAISPYREAREAARRTIGDFVEVHVAPPLEECIRRDRKGLYAKALAGEIQGFTGVSDPYEPPERPELVLDTSQLDLGASLARVHETLARLGYLPPHEGE
jgi:adenylyl-sulfate kinase